MYNRGNEFQGGRKPMRRFVTSALAAGVALVIMLVAQSGRRAIAADESSLLRIDNEFVQDAAKDDKAGVGKLLDMDFTWTDPDGKTPARAEVLKSLPPPALGSQLEAKR